MCAISENEQFERGVTHFNAREFFEAHEVWEELWLRAPEPEKAFLQGIIQIAAAFHHYRRKNPRGAKSLLTAGITKLKKFPRSHRGIDVARFLADAQEWSEALAEGKNPGAEKLPTIRLGHRKEGGA